MHPKTTTPNGNPNEMVIGLDDPILVTGATGFIGPRLVANLLDRGFRNVRCFTRPSSNPRQVEAILGRRSDGATVQLITGNLLSREDCLAATKDVTVIYHLAAGRGEKSFPDAFMNSVVTTRNLLDAVLKNGALRRFVNVSSFAVYANKDNPKGTLLDESAPVNTDTRSQSDAYSFAKLKQDAIIEEYGKKYGLPYAIVRPGYVYGPGNPALTGRVGIRTFGPFLHLGGSNTIPFTYVDNCAEAILLVGLKKGIDGEVFNVVDDDLFSSRRLLRQYKRNVKNFRSFYIPHGVSYLMCSFWEWYARWSQGQLPPAFNRGKWRTFWKKTRYTNEKLKTRVGWTPKVSTADGLARYFESCRNGGQHA